jgi:GlcNAc-P-P-Und epimerase
VNSSERSETPAGLTRPRRVLCTGGSGFIGTHFVDHMLERPLVEILSVDVRRPATSNHETTWRRVDILDRDSVEKTFKEFGPTDVVHLAARADMAGDSLGDYSPNTVGTANVLAAARGATALQRIIIASTQHVRRPGSTPASGDEDYEPYEMYGLSKAVSEDLVRQSGLTCCWTIVRPTAVWGPGHLGLASGFWKTLARGVYLHPRGDRVIRSYGYVKNVVFQLAAILDAPRETVDSKVFYLGDPCISQLEWVNAFAIAITGQPVRTAPRWFLHIMALVGESARRLGLPAPLYLSRYRNMITSNVVPIEKAIEVLGAGPYSLEEGVIETVAWLRDEGII